MPEALEREVKLEPADGQFALPSLPGDPLESRVFTSTYYDTPARSLARAGITLRRRLEKGISLWQLELPRPEGRTELEQRGGPAGPPAEYRRLLVAHLRHGPLEQVATLRTRRTGVRVVESDRALADVVVDDVDVMDASRTTGHFSEIEVGLVEGDNADLDRLAQTLRQAGATTSSGVPMLLRVLGLDQEGSPAKKAPPLDHLRYLLERQVRQIETTDPGVRLGGDDEDVHKLRVATRRSRALLRAARTLLGDRLEELNAELKWLGGALGPVRDLDVLVDHLNREVATLDVDGKAGTRIVATLEGERSQARETLLEALSSERYIALLDRFESELALMPSIDTRTTLHDLAERDFRKLRKAFAALGDNPSDDELHAARIRAKRARYTAELASAVEGKAAARFAEEVKELQDVIGTHQDAVVAEERVRAVARNVAAGRLVERERARRREMRARVPDVWKRVERAGRKAFG
jgi:CHAD domain-containing protein